MGREMILYGAILQEKGKEDGGRKRAEKDENTGMGRRERQDGVATLREARMAISGGRNTERRAEKMLSCDSPGRLVSEYKLANGSPPIAPLFP
jgi:hypothetical protein